MYHSVRRVSLPQYSLKHTLCFQSLLESVKKLSALMETEFYDFYRHIDTKLFALVFFASKRFLKAHLTVGEGLLLKLFCLTNSV